MAFLCQKPDFLFFWHCCWCVIVLSVLMGSVPLVVWHTRSDWVIYGPSLWLVCLVFARAL